MKYDKCKVGKYYVDDHLNFNGINLHELNGNVCLLKDLICKFRPNLIVSGSLSWPPFNSCTLDFVSKLYENLSQKINIILIYISEAHAADEWPISHSNQTLQHKNIQERIQAARNVHLGSGFKIYCDSFGDNNYENKFSAWPERALIVEGEENVLKYISQHEVNGLDDWYSDVKEYFYDYLN